jgi:hypothetical protein
MDYLQWGGCLKACGISGSRAGSGHQGYKKGLSELIELVSFFFIKRTYKQTALKSPYVVNYELKCRNDRNNS